MQAIKRLKEMGKKPLHKDSKLSQSLLQNYLLAICLMKNIALRHLTETNPTSNNKYQYNLAMKDQMDKLCSVEAVFILKRQQANASIRSTEQNLSFDY